MNQRVIRADGIELATQAFGDPGQPPVPLHHGRHGVHALVGRRILRALGRSGLSRASTMTTGTPAIRRPIHQGKPPYGFR